MTSAAPLLLTLLLGLTSLACHGSSGESTAPEATLTVLAASSLTAPFTELAEAFEAQHPGVQVTLSFAGSQALATQVRHGLEADVFASADARHAEALVEEGLLEAPRPFAENTLVLALSGDRSLDLESLGEADGLILGAPEVPLGRYTAELVEAGRSAYGSDWAEAVAAQVVSQEPNARLVVTKLGLGEAEAALVYGTDVGEGLRVVALPEALAPTPVYHHAALREAGSPELAAAWVALVEGEEGREVLEGVGFGGLGGM